MITDYEKPVSKRLTSGAMLMEAREGLGFSIADVARELRLSASQIVALENDDYSELPGTTYVRGYLRSYARLVKINEDSVLPPLISEAVAAPIHPVSQPTQRQARSSDRWVRLMSYALGILLVVLTIVWWKTQGGIDLERDLFATNEEVVTMENEDNATSPRVVAKVSEPTEITTPVLTMTPTSPAVSSATKPTTLRDLDSGVQKQQAAASVRAPKSFEETSSASLNSATSSKNRRDDAIPRLRKVVLRFIEASWAEIRDAANRRLVHQSFNAGRVVEVDGLPPFRVFLGNAGGVRMEYNGKPFDITPFQTGLYARFIVEGEDGN